MPAPQPTLQMGRTPKWQATLIEQVGLLLKIGVCSRSNVNRQILETKILYEHPLQIRQGFAGDGSD